MALVVFLCVFVIFRLCRGLTVLLGVEVDGFAHKRSEVSYADVRINCWLIGSGCLGDAAFATRVDSNGRSLARGVRSPRTVALPKC